MSEHKKSNKLRKKKRFSWRHAVALFVVYGVLFGVLSAMVDYYSYDMINPWVFIVLSIVCAILATYYHLKSHQRTKADELARELEEVL